MRRCPECNYNLCGHGRLPVTCPECGAVVTKLAPREDFGKFATVMLIPGGLAFTVEAVLVTIGVQTIQGPHIIAAVLVFVGACLCGWLQWHQRPAPEGSGQRVGAALLMVWFGGITNGCVYGLLTLVAMGAYSLWRMLQ